VVCSPTSCAASTASDQSHDPHDGQRIDQRRISCHQCAPKAANTPVSTRYIANRPSSNRIGPLAPVRNKLIADKPDLKQHFPDREALIWEILVNGS
jgi:hypothetical protein